MNDPRQKEKNEDDPVVQVIDSLNNAIDDLELADNELDQSIQDIDSSITPTDHEGPSSPQPHPSNTSMQQKSSNDPDQDIDEEQTLDTGTDDISHTVPHTQTDSSDKVNEQQEVYQSSKDE